MRTGQPAAAARKAVWSAIIVTGCGDLVTDRDGVELGPEVMAERINETFDRSALWPPTWRPSSRRIARFPRLRSRCGMSRPTLSSVCGSVRSSVPVDAHRRGRRTVPTAGLRQDHGRPDRRCRRRLAPDVQPVLPYQGVRNRCHRRRDRRLCRPALEHQPRDITEYEALVRAHLEIFASPTAPVSPAAFNRMAVDDPDPQLVSDSEHHGRSRHHSGSRSRSTIRDGPAHGLPADHLAGAPGGRRRVDLTGRVGVFRYGTRRETIRLRRRLFCERLKSASAIFAPDVDALAYRSVDQPVTPRRRAAR